MPRSDSSSLALGTRLASGLSRVCQKYVFVPYRELAYVTFGGAPGLYEWSVISETVCNLMTAIKHNDNWDPSTLFGINQHLVTPKKFLDDSIPFTKGLDLIVEIDIDPQGTTDVYIDDLISLAVDVEGTDCPPTSLPHMLAPAA